jgi:hypothetical protein
MFTRTALLLALGTSVFLGPGLSTAAETSPSPAPSSDLPGAPASAESVITIVNASAEQAGRVRRAIGLYGQIGLELPDLQVVFSSHDADCGGATGLFTTDTAPWRITLCSLEVGNVVEHELAHAWERANVSEPTRDEFMEKNGYTVWRSHDVPWNERAVEGVAVVIQQGISGLPLPPALGSEATHRLQSFELLTGLADPRLTEWLASHEVECSQRPTLLSGSIPDLVGRTCPRAR